MTYLIGFHAIHFWNPRSTLINPGYFLFLGYEILLKSASACCEFLLVVKNHLVGKGLVTFSSFILFSWKVTSLLYREASVFYLYLPGHSLQDFLQNIFINPDELVHSPSRAQCGHFVEYACASLHTACIEVKNVVTKNNWRIFVIIYSFRVCSRKCKTIMSMVKAWIGIYTISCTL